MTLTGMSGAQIWAGLALVLYLAGLGTVLLNPSPALPTSGVLLVAETLGDLGLPQVVVTNHWIEFVMNALVFVPVPVLGSLVLTSWGWRAWTACGLLASLGVELCQWMFLKERSPSGIDVVANILGAWVGGVLAPCITGLAARAWRRMEELRTNAWNP